MRLIDADAFVEDLKTEIMNLYLDGMKGTPRPRSELYDIIDRIDEQPTVNPEDCRPQWISVEERLPPDGHRPYLTCRKTPKGKTIIETRYLTHSYYTPHEAYWEGKKVGEVTHWMPLPEPPKGE